MDASACALLCVAASHDTPSANMGEELLQLLCQCLQKHMNTPMVTQWAHGAIKLAVANPSNIKTITKLGGVALVMQTISTHSSKNSPDSHHATLRACQTLRTLAGASDNMEQFKDAVRLLLNIVLTASAPNAVHENALCALSTVCANVNNRAYAHELKGVDVVLACMSETTKRADSNIMAASCGALTKMPMRKRLVLASLSPS